MRTFRKARGRMFLAVALATALLLCHGVTGSAHPAAAGDGHSYHHAPSESGGPAHELGAADCYVTVLLVFALRAGGASLLAARFRRRSDDPWTRSPRRAPRTRAPHLPRASTAPALQVFRL